MELQIPGRPFVTPWRRGQRPVSAEGETRRPSYSAQPRDFAKQSAPTSPAAEEESAAILNTIESNILEAIGTKRMVGEKIAKPAGYPFNSNLKATLSSMRKRGMTGPPLESLSSTAGPCGPCRLDRDVRSLPPTPTHRQGQPGRIREDLPRPPPAGLPRPLKQNMLPVNIPVVVVIRILNM